MAILKENKLKAIISESVRQVLSEIQLMPNMGGEMDPAQRERIELAYGVGKAIRNYLMRDYGMGPGEFGRMHDIIDTHMYAIADEILERKKQKR